MTDEPSDHNDVDDEAQAALDAMDDPEVPAEGNSPVSTVAAGSMTDTHRTGEQQAAENRENDPPA